MNSEIPRIESLLAVSIRTATLLERNLRHLDQLISGRAAASRQDGLLELPETPSRSILRKAVVDIAQEHTVVTVPMIVRELRARGVQVNSFRPEAAVGNGVIRLMKRGFLERIERGRGRTPATFRYVEPRQKGLW
jgi:hypothetical protein